MKPLLRMSPLTVWPLATALVGAGSSEGDDALWMRPELPPLPDPPEPKPAPLPDPPEPRMPVLPPETKSRPKPSIRKPFVPPPSAPHVEWKGKSKGTRKDRKAKR